jgi:hypothetical protein
MRHLRRAWRERRVLLQGNGGEVMVALCAAAAVLMRMVEDLVSDADAVARLPSGIL